MRNRNGWLSLAALLAIGMSAGACADNGSDHPVVDPRDDCAAIRFGPQAVNGMATREVVFRNEGNKPLSLASIAVDPPFFVEATSRAPLAPGASTAIRFTFRPTAVGVFETKTSVGRACFALTGESVTPALTCAPAAVDFGSVERGKIAQREIECTNPTVLDTRVSVPAGMAGEHKDSFTYGARLQEGALVRAGEKLRFPVFFHAEGAPGARAAAFTLAGGDHELATIALVGDMIASAIAAGPSCDDGGLQFGYVPPGTAIEKTLSLRNLGSEPLSVSGLSLTGPDAASFSLSTTAPLTIPADDPATAEAENEAQVVVSFAPSADALVGQKSAALRIHNSSNTPVFDACIGGRAGGPRIACAPGTLDFGPAILGRAVTRSYVCTNDGIDDPREPVLDNLLVESVALSGSADFTAQIRNTDGTTGPKNEGYAAGERFTVEVTYTPAGGEGMDVATIALATNDVHAPVHETEVAGDGRDLPPCDFEIVPVPGSLYFGNVAPGQSATLEIGVQNNLGTECLITDVRIGDDARGVYTVDMPGHLTLPGVTQEAGSGQLRIPVTFSPPADVPSTGDIFTGKLQFDISNPASPHQVVALRGASRPPCLVATPGHLDFGTVGPGCSTIEREITVYNVCDHALEVTAIDQYLGVSDEFEILERPVLPARLGRGEHIRFTAAYTPQDVGEDIVPVLIHVLFDRDWGSGWSEPYMATMQGRGALDPLQTDRFEQEDLPKVDVLWVIDNSASMGPFQAALASNLGSFLSYATASQVDFQLGVTTTGVTLATGTPERSCPGGVDGFENGRLFPVVGATPRILTPQTPNLAAAWANNVNVGMCHGTERGLQAAERALGVTDVADIPTTPEPNDGNLGFLRPDAALAIVFVSDEPDQSPDTASYYYNNFMSIRGVRHHNRFAAHAIVGDPLVGCATGEGFAGDGSRYVDVVEASGGAFESICTDDWTASLERIGRSVFGVKTRYFLGNHPEDRDGDGAISDRVSPPEIEVFADGARLASRTGQAGNVSDVWVYNPDTNSIDFMPNHKPEPGTQIEVTYKPACL